MTLKMNLLMVAITLSSVSSNASADTPSGAKLVIRTPNAIAVTDYATIERCERARTVFLAQVRKDAEASVPSGYHLIKAPDVSATCIPG